MNIKKFNEMNSYNMDYYDISEGFLMEYIDKYSLTEYTLINPDRDNFWNNYWSETHPNRGNGWYEVLKMLNSSSAESPQYKIRIVIPSYRFSEKEFRDDMNKLNNRLLKIITDTDLNIGTNQHTFNCTIGLYSEPKTQSIKKFNEMFNQYDYDYILRIMKKSHGWGNGILASIDEFELNGGYFGHPEDSNDYASQFHIYLTDKSSGKIRGMYDKGISSIRIGNGKGDIVHPQTSFYSKLT